MSYYNINDEGFWDIGPDDEENSFSRKLAHAMNLTMARFPLGDPDDGQAPMASVLYMPPGYVLWRHRHNCYRFEAIIKGSVTSGDRVLGPGDIMVTKPNEAYGPYTVGPEGMVTVEIFSRTDEMGFETVEDTDPEQERWLRSLLDSEDAELAAAAKWALR